MLGQREAMGPEQGERIMCEEVQVGPRSPLAWRRVQRGFLSMWLFVSLVSAYDAWLAVKYWDSLVQMERNPVCQYLIDIAPDDSSIFLRVKTSGTLAVLSVLASLYRNRPRLAMPVTAAVSVFQFGLLLYLTENLTGWR
ncbi:MAG: hypothetical protein B7Z73_13315 [Planctomycetia bacterium 21-64-5]|nr:MAG: hypothetical protein B7Z73_13315 [Planctomycetia bacterium 21-64-5]